MTIMRLCLILFLLCLFSPTSAFIQTPGNLRLGNLDLCTSSERCKRLPIALVERQSIPVFCTMSSAPAPEAMKWAKLLKDRPLFNIGVVGGKPCAEAFEQKRHLTTEELDVMRVVALHDDYDDDGAPFSARRAVVELLRDQENVIVASAKAEVLQRFPGITEPGGGLYPEKRSDACWKDFCTFLQCVTYATAADVPAFTNSLGAEYMRGLYKELNVPLDAMVVGVEALQNAARVQTEGGQATRKQEESSLLRRGWPAAKAAFDHLIFVLRSFF